MNIWRKGVPGGVTRVFLELGSCGVYGHGVSGKEFAPFWGTLRFCVRSLYIYPHPNSCWEHREELGWEVDGRSNVLVDTPSFEIFHKHTVIYI